MTDLSPETVGKLVAFVRKAAAHVSPMAQYSAVRDHLGAEARAIAAELPKPVDPDRHEADNICSAVGGICWGDPGAREAVYLAIKRGRALAAGDRL